MYLCESNYLFAIKCLMNNNPTKIVFINIISSIFIFGHALRISERFLK